MAHVIKTFFVMADSDDRYRVRVHADLGGVYIALEELNGASWRRTTSTGGYPLSKDEAMALSKILLNLAEEMEDLR